MGGVVGEVDARPAEARILECGAAFAAVGGH
jgi:hypothetical protein